MDSVIGDEDTGEQFDVRNESHIEIMLTQWNSATLIQNQQNTWQTFWNKVRELNEKLWDAAELGQVEIVTNLLQRQKELKNEHSVILKSEESLYENHTQLLDVNAKSLDGWTALHYAVNEGHLQIVQLLLEAKANPIQSTSLGRTPLHIACLRNKFEIVKLLIETSTVDINGQDNDFNTPLHIAAEIGLMEIVTYLLQNGADPTILNFQQKTPYDLTIFPEVRNAIKKHNQQFQNYDPAKKYQRSEIGGVVVPNSRSDHVERLMQQLKRTQSDEVKQKQQPLKRPSRIMFFERISIAQKASLGPQNFTFHKLLGKGSFGEVYLATKKNSSIIELYAIKVLNKDKVFAKNLTKYAQTEKNVLSVMKHPFIVKLHGAFQTNAKLFLVMEFCPGGDLGQLLCRFTRFSEDVARFYICEVLLALEALHKNCIIFRDLKPDNVVIDNKGHAKLTDFGLSKEGVYDNPTKSFCGSIAYLAPEVLMKRGHSRTVDWYLLGVLLYELIVGIPPYYNQNRDVLFDNIKRGPLRIPKTMSDEAKDLIKQLLIRDPGQRLGVVNDSDDIKKHPFFKTVNWQEVEDRMKEGPYVEKDKSEKLIKETIQVNFEEISVDGGGENDAQKLNDWSFVNNK